jgi:hypothetical protein
MAETSIDQLRTKLIGAEQDLDHVANRLVVEVAEEFGELEAAIKSIDVASYLLGHLITYLGRPR